MADRSGMQVKRGPDLPAGGFSSWLRRMREALRDEQGMDVPCGDCTACCTSSHFVLVRPDEAGTLARAPRGLLVPAPCLTDGSCMAGYDQRGVCALFSEGGCSIYEDRPRACRNYDCRIFAAAGVAPDRAAIGDRVRRWRFSYPGERDRREHDAVMAAAAFIRAHAGSFPGSRVPADPGQLAVVAVKVYTIFPAGTAVNSPAAAAQAVVAACHDFDEAPLDRKRADR